MFDQAYDPNVFSQAVNNLYFDKKKAGVTNSLNEADMFFLYRPKHKPNTTEERDEQIAKSKILPEIDLSVPCLPLLPPCHRGRSIFYLTPALGMPML